MANEAGNELMLATGIVVVEQLVERLSNHDDRIVLPAGETGKGSSKSYDASAVYMPEHPADWRHPETKETEAEAALLDEFHCNMVAIGCLEDFSITADQVKIEPVRQHAADLSKQVEAEAARARAEIETHNNNLRAQGAATERTVILTLLKDMRDGLSWEKLQLPPGVLTIVDGVIAQIKARGGS